MFRLLAPFYDPAMRLAGVSHGEAAKLLAPLSSDVVLDLGGGTGLGARAVARLAGCKALVVDRSWGMVSRAPTGSLVARVLGDANTLPLPDASVDGALILDALHHFSQPTLALREVGRVLKPGGRLVIEELDGTRTTMRGLGRLEHLLGEPGTMWSAAEVGAMVKDAGLSLSAVHARGGLVLVVAENSSRNAESR